QYYPDDQQPRQFTVRQDQDAFDSKPLNLNPRLLISRSDLPLAFIDVDDPEKQSRIFSGCLTSLWALDLQSESGTLLAHSGSKVMIVEDVDGSGLYAVSLARKTFYVLVKLRSWVTLEDFQQVLRVPQRPMSKYQGKEHVEGNVWWRAAAVDLGTQSYPGYQEVPGTKRIRLSMRPPSPPLAMAHGVEEPTPPQNNSESYDRASERASKMAGDLSLQNTNHGPQVDESKATQVSEDNNQDYAASIQSIQHLIRAQYQESLRHWRTLPKDLYHVPVP
ncbi:MAG: hypothetical protein Q9187_008954, partial [Circinaria calcarea]